MSEQLKKTPCGIGLLAHVDAGKTTLSEALLYVSGAKRTLGRVDHGDAHLDTHELERARGITIFSKQARLSTDALDITLGEFFSDEKADDKVRGFRLANQMTALAGVYTFMKNPLFSWNTFTKKSIYPHEILSPSITFLFYPNLYFELRFI